MKKIGLIFLICFFKLSVFGQTTHKYYSYQTVLGNTDYPDLAKTVKESVTIFINENSKTIDIYFADQRKPVLVEYANIDAKPEAAAYRLYENNWGWATFVFSTNKEGLMMYCIPVKKSSLSIIYGPLEK
ncbi:MAG: hypothetical protein PSX36_09235 [bacterium]|nr:hypothetical protein [bacterium]